MTYLQDVTATKVIAAPMTRSAETFQDLLYLVGFAAVGLFFSMLSMMIAGAEWLPEDTVIVSLAAAG